jgi:hypothetical protein
MLMDAPITVEFGVKLSESRTIHEGMLLKCSKKLQGVYNKAQQYRKSYAKCKKLSEEVESLIMKEMTVEDVQKGETEQEVGLAHHVHNTYHGSAEMHRPWCY